MTETSRRTLRRAGLSIAAVVAVQLAGCMREATQPLVEYVDLVTEDPTGPLGEEARAFQRLCGDETRFGRPGLPGEPIVEEVELGGEPSFTVAACREGQGAASLTLTVEASGVEPAVLNLDLSAERPQWKRAELDLARLAGKRAVVRLETAAPATTQLWISDAYVRHRVPAPEGDRETAEPQPGRRILLISADTLRADAVGGATATASATPALDRLAADGEIFTSHIAGANWTRPSHATMLTGYLAGVHGAGDGPLRRAVPTIAELLSGAGMATGGAVHDCVWLNPKFGFDRGFDDYRSRVWGTGQLARAAVDWIARHRDRSFFFFLHTLEPHSDFWRLPYEGAGATQPAIRRRFGARGYGCRAGVCATGLLSALGNGLIAPLPREPAILRHLYKAGVRSTDSELGRLFADLQAMGLYDDLLVIVTSDHGEMLLEHGAVLHGTFWEEVLHVPLIVKWPGNARAGTLTQRRTSAMDLVPTLLAVAGLPADPDLPGRDLRSPDRRSVLANIGPWLAVYDGSLKALVNDAENHQLYDVAADPGETRDLAAERPADLARLVAAATAWKESEERRLGRFERHPDEGGAVTLTPEEEERLRALGYLGGAR